MSSKIYGKLAITNLKNNRKTYVPYILMAVLSVMMYYIVGGMAQGNNGLSKNVKMIMGYMNGLLMIFSVIFLFYTNSFLIKRRKREIGIYNILGMGKGHIAKMLAIEAVITAFISIFGGIILGIVFGKLMYLVLGKLLHYDISVKVTVEIPVLEKTFVFFMAIFVLILLYNLLQIRIVSPVELLHGSNQGEREPKTKWLLAIVGAILLGTGYYIAQTTGNPLDAMTKFFFAVVCVVLGTYGLFIAGSIAVLKMLKKNKKYYYQAKHFTAVSGMVYRMKQNAVGLANICILSTMVLIMVSTTVYKIMQQVGMDKQEVKKSIRSQVLMIFFLPLIMAIIHVAAAFKVITKLLAMFSMTNITLFIECTIATIIVFAVIYCIVFMVTEREYYRIVK